VFRSEIIAGKLICKLSLEFALFSQPEIFEPLTIKITGGSNFNNVKTQMRFKNRPYRSSNKIKDSFKRKIIKVLANFWAESKTDDKLLIRFSRI
jgi:hypothetical protein